MATGSARILVVEDDATIRGSLRAALGSEGYEVYDAEDGQTISEVASRFRPDLAVLDVRLPRGPNGLGLAQALRATEDTAILLLTAADSLDDRLAGFAAGCDDYLVKPFSMAELLARVGALLRRAGKLSASVWQFEDLVIDDGAHTVRRGAETVDVTRTEYDLLSVLARRPGQVITKTQLLTQVWGFDAYDPNLVEVHVSALRRKLEATGGRVIHTVRGVGYVLRR